MEEVQIPEGAIFELNEFQLKKLDRLKKSGEIMNILSGCTISDAKDILQAVTDIFEETVVPIPSSKEANDYAKELVRKFKHQIFYRQNDGHKIVNPFNKKD